HSKANKLVDTSGKFAQTSRATSCSAPLPPKRQTLAHASGSKTMRNQPDPPALLGSRPRPHNRSYQDSGAKKHQMTQFPRRPRYPIGPRIAKLLKINDHGPNS